MKTDELKTAKFLLKKVDKEYPSLFKNGKLISPYGADSTLRETTPTRVKEEISDSAVTVGSVERVIGGLMMDKIEITVDGNKTIAKMGGKKGVAKCSPEDEFNIFTGARLAIDRLEEECSPYSWLKKGVKYYYPEPSKVDLFDYYPYADDVTDKRYRSRGLVFKTKEEAIEVAKKMLAVLKEG